jgi:hypothetical protein
VRSLVEDDFSELDFVLVVGFRRSFSIFRHLYLLFFARFLLLLLAATLTALVVIVVVVDIALLFCRAPFPGWALREASWRCLEDGL